MTSETAPAIAGSTKLTWTTDQLLFMQWLAMPTRLRKPRTQLLLAGELGRAETTLSEWKLLPGFGEQVIALQKAYLRSSDVMDVIRAQVALAKDTKKGAASTGAARFLMELIGELVSGPRGEGAAAGAGSSSAAAAIAMAMVVNVDAKAVDAIQAEQAAARKLLQDRQLLIDPATAPEE